MALTFGRVNLMRELFPKPTSEDTNSSVHETAEKLRELRVYQDREILTLESLIQALKKSIREAESSGE